MKYKQVCIISTFPFSKVEEGSALSLSCWWSEKSVSQSWKEWSWQACNMSYLMEVTELVAVKVQCHSLIKPDVKQGYVHSENFSLHNIIMMPDLLQVLVNRQNLRRISHS